ncbi:MAG: hypothetical protein M8357_01855 [Desulfobulbaceae bacterium]|nr:hypothetical protein [Desulfobulbaceae bacterium]
MTDTTRFTVLEGGRGKQPTVNTVSLAVVPDSLSPLPAEVRVFEEDTHLVLTVDPVIRYTEEHPIRLMTSVMEAKPRKPGSVVTNSGSWYAVVHDLDREPTWRQAWIEKAYREILLLGEKKRIRKIGVPLLGSVHGNFSPDASMKMLLQAIDAAILKQLKNILILVPSRDCSAAGQILQKLIKGPVQQPPHGQ